MAARVPEIARKGPGFHAASRHGKIDPAYRFFFCSAIRSGNASDPDCKIRAESFARTLGHFARDRFAYGPVSRERFSANAEKLPLRRVAVSDHSAEENHRRTGHVREPVRDATAGARFGQRKSLLSFC